MELQKTKAEPSTQDHVFILSLQEAGLYAMDIDSSLLSYKSKYDYSYSWLRTHANPTVYDTGAMVSGYQDFYPWGFYTDEPMPVRPAIWVLSLNTAGMLSITVRNTKTSPFVCNKSIK